MARTRQTARRSTGGRDPKREGKVESTGRLTHDERVILHLKLKADCVRLGIKFPRDPPHPFSKRWRGLTEEDILLFEHVVGYSNSEIFYMRQRYTMEGLHIASSSGYPTANFVRTADKGKYMLLKYPPYSYV